MAFSRRRFLHQAAALGFLHGSHRAFSQTAPMRHMQIAGAKVPNAPDSNHPMLHALQLTPFVDPMPVPGPLGAPQPDKVRITLREIHAKVHRDVPATRFWSYGPDPLGPVIEARSGRPLQIEWINNLPTKHFLPIDHSLHGCGTDLPDVRTITHVHGAKVPSKDDGYPEDWFVPGKSRVCHYPLQQSAATLWYHDHAMGINRLNSYAGLAGLFLIRDDAEDALNLPAGKYEVPLVLYDRDFTTDGQLFYGISGDPDHPWIPEFNADGILINGKIRPYFEVEPRLYRFRAVNVANSRFFALALDNNHPLIQIGSDQGLLAAPVELKILSLAPAERADLLIDFTPLAGKTIHMNTGGFDILQFRVAAKTASTHNNIVPQAMPAIRRTLESEAITTRTITLSEYHDRNGNPMVMLLNRKHWHEPVTETPKLNSTEIWEFVNLTEDTHPMHLHLVRFQVLDRRVFEPFAYETLHKVRFNSPPLPPMPNELGWKDTVQCPANMITRIIVRFEGYTGKYLYHCHILEHESNDMMRPFEVIA